MLTRTQTRFCVDSGKLAQRPKCSLWVCFICSLHPLWLKLHSSSQAFKRNLCPSSKLRLGFPSNVSLSPSTENVRPANLKWRLEEGVVQFPLSPVPSSDLRLEPATTRSKVLWFWISSLYWYSVSPFNILFFVLWLYSFSFTN